MKNSRRPQGWSWRGLPPPRLPDFRPRPLPSTRTVWLSAAMLLAGLVLAPIALVGPSAAPMQQPELAWWQLAPIFGLAGVFVFHVELNGDAHTFSLSEVPFVLGLFFASPLQLVIARMVGEIAVLVCYERQPPAKVAFNTSLFFGESMLALAVFRPLIGGRELTDPVAWSVALVAVASAAALGATAVWAVIRLHAGQVEARKLVPAGVITGVGNGCLGIVAALLLRQSPLALIPLIVIGAVVVAAYRGYTRLTKRYDGLELLYQFTRITSGPWRPEETLRHVLDEASRLLRARRAVIELWQPDQPVPWLSLSISVDDPQAEDPQAGGAVTSQLRMATVDAVGAALPEAIHRDVVLGGCTVLIPRTTHRMVDRLTLDELGAQDCLASPLRSGGEVTGVLLVADRLGQVSTFDSDDARLFATLAAQAAVALEHGRLIERLHEQVAAREHEATHDALTGLANRGLFARRLGEAVAGDREHRLGVLLMDLDGFKEVNDTLGHHIGDELLCQVAERLQAAAGDAGTVARLGGDEFAVLLPGLAGPEDAVACAARIHTAVSRPIQLESLSLEVSASIGVAIRPEHGDDPTILLQRADVAMYAAKANRAGITVYDPRTDWNSELRLRLAGELRFALQNQQLDVHYQPITRTSDGAVVSTEALVRWTHPELGRIAPDQFIPIAERTGLIHELTLYVLDHALAQVRAWRNRGLDLTVAVNLSVPVLRDVEWPAKVTALLARHAVAADRLTFEITETAIMTDPKRMIRTLEELAATGVSFAIDDFGAGYSSLAYLQQLPVGTVKIDKSLIAPMNADPVAAAIVRSVVDLARNLNLSVVAEGVEDQRTLDHLAAINCHYVQGHYLSAPVSERELSEWVNARRRLHRAALRLRQQSQAAVTAGC